MNDILRSTRFFVALGLLAVCCAACDDDGRNEGPSTDTASSADTASGDVEDTAAPPDTNDPEDTTPADLDATDTSTADAEPDADDAEIMDVEVIDADVADVEVEDVDVTDVEVADVEVEDAADTADMVDADLADGSGCGADCTTTAVADFGSGDFPFDRAFYGLSAPEITDSGEWEIYVEAHYGGSMDCPDENSPTPDRTLIVHSVIVPLPMTPTDAGATVLDFEGSLLTSGSIFTASQSATVTIVGGDVCTSCVGMAAPSDPDGFVSLDLTATFAEGTVSGHIYATHCDSMDATAP